MAHRISILVFAIVAAGCGSSVTVNQKGPNGSYDRTVIQKPLGGSSDDTMIDTTPAYKSCMDTYGHDPRAEAYCRSQTAVPIPGSGSLFQSLSPGASLYTPVPQVTFPYQGLSNPPIEITTPGQLAAVQSGSYYTLAPVLPQSGPTASVDGRVWTETDARIVGSTLVDHERRIGKIEGRKPYPKGPAKK